MASRPTKRTRKSIQEHSATKKRHRRTQLTYWPASRILKDNDTHYLVEWDGVDLVTRTPYQPTWEPHSFVTPALESEWKANLTQSSSAKTHSHGHTQDGRQEALSSVHENPAMQGHLGAAEKEVPYSYVGNAKMYCLLCV